MYLSTVARRPGSFGRRQRGARCGRSRHRRLCRSLEWRAGRGDRPDEARVGEGGAGRVGRAHGESDRLTDVLRDEAVGGLRRAVNRRAVCACCVAAVPLVARTRSCRRRSSCPVEPVSCAARGGVSGDRGRGGVDGPGDITADRGGGRVARGRPASFRRSSPCTSATSACPTSAAPTVYAAAVAPAIAVQRRPFGLQRCHAYVTLAGAGLHAPAVTCSGLPSIGKPVICGWAVETRSGFAGATGPTRLE